MHNDARMHRRLAPTKEHYTARWVMAVLAVLVNGALFSRFVHLIAPTSIRTPHKIEPPALTLLSLADEPYSVPKPAPQPRLTQPTATLPRAVHPTAAPSEPSIAPLEPSQEPIDWQEEKRKTTAAITARESTSPRSFGPNGSPNTVPQPQQSFGWDKAATQRLEVLPQGGILIRITDNCQLVLMPLPLGGCRLGKTKPRGDLFERRTKPVELGDWKNERLP